MRAEEIQPPNVTDESPGGDMLPPLARLPSLQTPSFQELTFSHWALSPSVSVRLLDIKANLL
jgi:hypothetical protein